MLVIKSIKFDKFLDKATNYKLCTPDWNSIYKISDFVNSQEVSPQHAISALKRKLHSDNQNVVILALSVLETLMNNCGTPVHNEVASTMFSIDLLHSHHSSEVIRKKIYGLINVWESAFSKKEQYWPLHNAYNEIKRSGFQFSPLTEREVTIIANLTSTVPTRSVNSTKNTNDGNQNAARLKEMQLAEEEELNLALALSASEAEAKEKEKAKLITKANETESKMETKFEPRIVLSNAKLIPEEETDIDTELARYLNRNYWTNRAASSVDGESIASPYISQPSAPLFNPPINPNYTPSLPDLCWQKEPNFEEKKFAGQHLPGVPPVTDEKREEFLNALRKSIDVFVNRIRVNSQRSRPIQNDQTVQALFHTLHAMHPQLLQYSSGLEQRRVYLEQLQDTATQIHEAREALEVLRRENAEKRRLEEAEARRKRHIELMQKVEILRQDKQKALEEQRRRALEQTLQFQQQYLYQNYQPGFVDPSMSYAQAGEHMTSHYPASIPSSEFATNYAIMGRNYLPQPMLFAPLINDKSGYDSSAASIGGNAFPDVTTAGLLFDGSHQPEMKIKEDDSPSKDPEDFIELDDWSQVKITPGRKLLSTKILVQDSANKSSPQNSEIVPSEDSDVDNTQPKEPQPVSKSLAPIITEGEGAEKSISAASSLSFLDMPDAPNDEFHAKADERDPSAERRVPCLE